jgi:uncharacterized protein YndB with AHSA1/START domain
VTVDPLADMAVEVTATFDAPIDQVWVLLSDVERMAGLGPEHVAATWLTTGPATGARFTGVNRRGEFTWEVPCVVTACRAPEFLEWTVGDAPDHSSTWSYALSGGRDGPTVVVQRFRHGPGFSFVRQRVDRTPDEAGAIIAGRSAMLRDGMEETLAAAARLLDQGGGAST